MANGVQDGQLVGDVLGKGVGTGLGIEHGTEIEGSSGGGGDFFLVGLTLCLRQHCRLKKRPHE